MAFNINAQVILSGPKNIQAVNKSIRRQLSGITIPVEIKLAKNATKRLGEFNRGVKSLTANLTKLRGVAAATNRDVKALVDSFDKLSRTSKSVATSTTRMATASGKSADAIKDARSELEAFGKDAALAIRRFTAFTVATGAVFGFVRAIQSAGKAALSFQTEITKVVQVTGANTGKIEKLKSTIDSLSVSLGVDANELAKLARTFAQTGQSIDQVRSSIRAVARSSLAPSFGEMTNTAEGLIAAMAQFNIGASKSEAVLGSLNAVSKKFAVEAEDLVSVIRRAGGVFSTAAGQMKDPQDALNELIGLFTAVRSTTRESADTIATGLRTIFTRIQRRGTIEFLKQFNIELLDARGNFVGLFPAFQRLSEGLRGLVQSGDAITLSAVTEELGGMRQVGKLIPALVNFNKALAATKVAAQGAAQGLGKDVSLALQPLAKQFEQLGARFNTFIRDVSESRTFQNLAKVALETANAFLFVAETLKPLIPLITTLTTIKITKGLLEFGRGFVGGIKKGGGAGGAGGALGGAVTGGGTPPAGGGGDTRRAVSDRELSQALRNSVTAVRANTVALNAVQTALIAVDKKMLLLGQTIQNEIRPLVVALRLSGGPGGGFRPPRPFARGGPVHGPSHAAGGVPAILEGGEYVIPKGYERGGDVIDITSAQIGKGSGIGAKKVRRGGGGSRQFGVAYMQPEDIDQQLTVDLSLGKDFRSKGMETEGFKRLLRVKGVGGTGAANDLYKTSLQQVGGIGAEGKKISATFHQGSLDSGVGDEFERTIKLATLRAGKQVIGGAIGPKSFSARNYRQGLKKANFEQTIGNLFEAALGATIGKWDDRRINSNAPFDYPSGLGAAAAKLDVPAGIPTDAKRSFSTDTLGNLIKKARNQIDKEAIDLVLQQSLSGQLGRQKALGSFTKTGTQAKGDIAALIGRSKGRNIEDLANDYRDLGFNLTQIKGGFSVKPRYKAAGGTIFKPRGTDTVPAMLTPGEFVINKSSAQSIGYGQLNKMNHMAKGGPVQYLAGGGPAVGGGLGTVGNLAIVAAGLATTLSSLDTSAMGLFNTLISLQFTMQSLGPLMQSSIAKSLGVSTFGKALNKPFLAASIGMKRFSKNLAKGAGARAASASAMRGMATVLGTTTKALAGFGAAAVGAMVIGPLIDAIANSAFGKEETVRGVSGRSSLTAGGAGALGSVKSAAQMGLTGAAIGTMIVPVVGTAVGAAIGTIGGAISGFISAHENQALFLTLDKLATNGDRVAAIFSKIANEGAGIGGTRTDNAIRGIQEQAKQQGVAIESQTIGTIGSFSRERGIRDQFGALAPGRPSVRTRRHQQGVLPVRNFDTPVMQRALDRASLTEDQQTSVQSGVSRLMQDSFENLPVGVLQQMSAMGPTVDETGQSLLVASGQLRNMRAAAEGVGGESGEAAKRFFQLRSAAEGSLIVKDAATELKRLTDLNPEKARAFSEGMGALQRDIGLANIATEDTITVQRVLKGAMDDAGIVGEQNRAVTINWIRARRAATAEQQKAAASSILYARIMKQAKKATDFFASALSSLSGAFQAAAARFSNGIDGVSSEIDQILSDRFKITAVKSINPFEDVKSATPQELQKGFDRIQRRNPNADISELRDLATVQGKLPAILQNTIRREERGQLNVVAGETEETRLSKDIRAQVNALGLNLGKEFFADLEGNIFRQTRQAEGRPQAQALSQLRNASEKSGEEISKLGGSATKTLSELTKSLDSFENDLVKSGQNLVKVFQFITKEQLAVLDRREAKEAALDKALGRMPNEMGRATTNLQNRLDVLAGAGGAAAPAQNVTVGELFRRRGDALQQRAAIGGPKDVSRAAGAAVHATNSNTEALKMLVKDTTILNATMKELDKSFQQEVDSGRAITQIGQAIVDLRSGKTSPKEFNKQVAGPIAVFEEFFKKLTTGQQVNLTGQQGFELSRALTSGDPLFAAQFEELFRRLAAQRGTDPGTERRRIERDLQGARSRFVQGALPQGPMSDFFKRNEQIRGRSIQEQQAGARNIQIINQQQDRIAKALNIDKLSLVQNQEQKTQILFAAAVVQFAKAVEAFSGRKFNDGGIVKMAKGGQVRGPSHGAGGVLTELEGGEFVIPKKFAEGGFVPGMDPEWARITAIKDPLKRYDEMQAYNKERRAREKSERSAAQRSAAAQSPWEDFVKRASRKSDKAAGVAAASTFDTAERLRKEAGPSMYIRDLAAKKGKKGEESRKFLRKYLTEEEKKQLDDLMDKPVKGLIGDLAKDPQRLQLLDTQAAAAAGPSMIPTSPMATGAAIPRLKGIEDAKRRGIGVIRTGNTDEERRALGTGGLLDVGLGAYHTRKAFGGITGAIGKASVAGQTPDVGFGEIIKKQAEKKATDPTVLEDLLLDPLNVLTAGAGGVRVGAKAAKSTSRMFRAGIEAHKYQKGAKAALKASQKAAKIQSKAMRAQGAARTQKKIDDLTAKFLKEKERTDPLMAGFHSGQWGIHPAPHPVRPGPRRSPFMSGRGRLLGPTATAPRTLSPTQKWMKTLRSASAKHRSEASGLLGRVRSKIGLDPRRGSGVSTHLVDPKDASKMTSSSIHEESVRGLYSPRKGRKSIIIKRGGLDMEGTAIEEILHATDFASGQRLGTAKGMVTMPASKLRRTPQKAIVDLMTEPGRLEKLLIAYHPSLAGGDPARFREMLKYFSRPTETFAKTARLYHQNPTKLRRIVDPSTFNAIRNNINEAAVIARGKGFNRGGFIPGYNKGGNVDTVPAMLTPGEFVMRKQSVDKYGQKFMNDINLSKVQLANGGGMMGMGGSKKSVSGTSRVGGASQDLEKAAKLATDSIVAGFTKGSEMVKQAIQDALSAESIGQQLASVLGQSLRENLSATSIEMKGNMGVDVNLTGPGAMGDISSTTQDNIKNTLATALTSIFNADGSQKDPSLHQPRV